MYLNRKISFNLKSLKLQLLKKEIEDLNKY